MFLFNLASISKMAVEWPGSLGGWGAIGATGAGGAEAGAGAGAEEGGGVMVYGGHGSGGICGGCVDDVGGGWGEEVTWF